MFTTTARVRHSVSAALGLSLALGVTALAAVPAQAADPEAPTVTLSAPASVVEGKEGKATATASDPQGDPLTYTWQVVGGGYVTPEPQTSPGVVFYGDDGPSTLTLQVTVSDGTHATTASTPVQVTNAAPWIETSVDQHFYLDAEQPFELIMSGSDVPGDMPWQCTVVPSHSGGVPFPATGDCVASYNAPKYGGVYRDLMRVSDGDGGVVEIPWYLHVTGPAAPEDPQDPPAQFPWSGFEGPVDDAPVVNVTKAGAAVPVQFSLGGDRGLDVLAAGSPASQRHGCEAGGVVDLLEETATAGQTGLRYDPATQRYSYTWKTQKAWAGTCRTFVLTLSDGSSHTAEFRFR